jgi:TetR/AcrR family transcriptional repressor of mexJK operon
MSLSVRQASKREQIRTAAAGLFLAHGFAGTSMDAVTAAAGVSKETLYRYYESKAALFADVLGQLIAEPPPLGLEPPVIRTRADLESVLIRGSQRYLGRVMEPEQMALLRIVIAEGSRFPDLVHAFRGTLPATGGAVILGALEAGRKAGLVASSVDLRVAARAFAGLLMMFILRDGLLVPQPRPPERTQIAEMVRIFLGGVAEGAGAT